MEEIKRKRLSDPLKMKVVGWVGKLAEFPIGTPCEDTYSLDVEVESGHPKVGSLLIIRCPEGPMKGDAKILETDFVQKGSYSKIWDGDRKKYHDPSDRFSIVVTSSQPIESGDILERVFYTFDRANKE